MGGGAFDPPHELRSTDLTSSQRLTVLLVVPPKKSVDESRHLVPSSSSLSLSQCHSLLPSLQEHLCPPVLSAARNWEGACCAESNSSSRQSAPPKSRPSNSTWPGFNLHPPPSSLPSSSLISGLSILIYVTLIIQIIFHPVSLECYHIHWLLSSQASAEHMCTHWV